MLTEEGSVTKSYATLNPVDAVINNNPEVVTEKLPENPEEASLYPRADEQDNPPTAHGSVAVTVIESLKVTIPTQRKHHVGCS